MMTNEELCEIMDNSNFMIDSNNKYDMKILEILNKQVPKKPIKDCYFDIPNVCPVCGQEFGFNSGFKYCENCGQALDWSEDDDE